MDRYILIIKKYRSIDRFLSIQQECHHTILHAFSEVRGRKICSNGKQTKFVDCSSAQIKHSYSELINAPWAAIKPF